MPSPALSSLLFIFRARPNSERCLALRSFASVVALFGILGGMCQVASAQADNLVVNPGFEGPISADFNGWLVPLDVHVGVNEGCGRNGSKCLRISGSGPNEGIFGADQYISGIVPGAHYDVSGWMSSRSIAQAAIVVHWYRNGGSVIRNVGDSVGMLIGTTPNETFERMERLLTAPADAFVARIRAVALIDSDPNFTSIVRFDDFSFTLAEPPATPTPAATATPSVDLNAPQLSNCSYRLNKTKGGRVIKFSYTVNDDSGVSFMKIILKKKGTRSPIASKQAGPVIATGNATQLAKIRVNSLSAGKYSLSATARDENDNASPACVVSFKVK